MTTMPRFAHTSLVALCLLGLAHAASAGTFIDAVIRFTPGDAAGFGADELPRIVQGPPRGGSLTEGSLDTVALGNGGVIVLGFEAAICDGPGPDFIVFENAFHAGSPSGPIFVEAGIVAVSPDDVTYTTFPYDPVSFIGLAGRSPVLSNPDNGIDPFDPVAAGGDAFDLATLGVGRVSFVRITDPGTTIADPGNRVPPGNSGGFDLDAIAVLHPCSEPIATPTPAFTPTPTATATATSTPPATTSAGDADGDGEVTVADRVWAEGELFDGDGQEAADVAGGSIPSTSGVDANDDGFVTAADLIGILLRLDP